MSILFNCISSDNYTKQRTEELYYQQEPEECCLHFEEAQALCSAESTGNQLFQLQIDQNEGERIGYYHFDKHLPANGYLICFSWPSEYVQEQYGVRQGEYIIYDNGRSIHLDKVDRRWRYVGYSEGGKYRLPNGNVKDIPFDEPHVYHCSETTLPQNGQKCFFVSLKGHPRRFGHEPLIEYSGTYLDGSFWNNGTKVTGLIYWREEALQQSSFLPDEEPLPGYLTEQDISRGLINPVDKAIWQGDPAAIRFIQKSGKYLPSDVLNIKYSSAEEAYQHYVRTYGRIGPIFEALRVNDVNAVSLMLDLSKKPGLWKNHVFGDYHLHLEKRERERKLYDRFLQTLRSHPYSRRIPKESAELFFLNGIITDFPVVFTNYNLDIMELGLTAMKYRRQPADLIISFSNTTDEFSSSIISLLRSSMELDQFYWSYLKIKPEDSEKLISQKKAMHELLKKYGWLTKYNQ